MDVRDSLSILAILISLGSLLLGYRNTAFQRRAKNIEARSAVIGKMFEVKRELSKMPIKIERIRTGVGQKVGADRLQKLVDAEKGLMESMSRLHKHHEEIEKFDKREGLALYEDAFNRTHHLLKETEACNEGLDALIRDSAL